MNKEEAKDLYEGKFFYEIVKNSFDRVTLFGPFDNIRYLTYLDHYDGTDKEKYKFCQVVDGKIVETFTEDQILVTDRKL